MIARVCGVHQHIVKLLYGSGLRITECFRLRVQDVDLEMKALTVRNDRADPSSRLDLLGRLAHIVREWNLAERGKSILATLLSAESAACG